MTNLQFYTVIVVLLVVMSAMVARSCSLSSQLKDEKEMHLQNLTDLTSEVRRLKYSDSVSAAQVSALTLRANDAERLCSKLRQDIKIMGIRMKDVANATEVITVNSDTVFIPLVDSIRVGHRLCYAYTDDWVNFDVCLLPDTLALAYTIRDTVETIVHIHYKKRFLWWHWKPQYMTTVVSHCPSSEVTGVTSVVIDD